MPMPDSYSSPSNCVEFKFSSKSDEIVILRLFLAKF